MVFSYSTHLLNTELEVSPVILKGSLHNTDLEARGRPRVFQQILWISTNRIHESCQLDVVLKEEIIILRTPVKHFEEVVTIQVTPFLQRFGYDFDLELGSSGC